MVNTSFEDIHENFLHNHDVSLEVRKMQEKAGLLAVETTVQAVIEAILTNILDQKYSEGVWDAHQIGSLAPDSLVYMYVTQNPSFAEQKLGVAASAAALRVVHHFTSQKNSRWMPANTGQGEHEWWRLSFSSGSITKRSVCDYDTGVYQAWVRDTLIGPAASILRLINFYDVEVIFSPCVVFDMCASMKVQEGENLISKLDHTLAPVLEIIRDSKYERSPFMRNIIPLDSVEELRTILNALETCYKSREEEFQEVLELSRKQLLEYQDSLRQQKISPNFYDRYNNIVCQVTA